MDSFCLKVYMYSHKAPVQFYSASVGFQLIAPSFPLSMLSSFCISASLREKSKISAFDRTRSGSEDFGSGTNLRLLVSQTYVMGHDSHYSPLLKRPSYEDLSRALT